jgi:hypothetical protein
LRAFPVTALAALVALGLAPAAFADGATIAPSPVAAPTTPATSPTVPASQIASPDTNQATPPPDAFAPYSNPAKPPIPGPAPSPSAAPKPQPQAPTPTPTRPVHRPTVEVAPTPWQHSPMKLGLVAFMMLSSLLAIAVVGRLLFERLVRRP